MKAALALTLLLAASGVEQPAASGVEQAAPVQQPEPPKNFSYEHKTPAGEFITIVKAEEATTIDLTKDKETVELRKVRAEYFTDPRNPEEKSETIIVEADRGRLEKAEKLLHVSERVRVTRPKDGTVLDASSALVDFDRGFECVACRLRQSAPGTCPRCQAPLRPKTFSTLRVDKDFLMIRAGEASLSGEGLLADDALGQLTVARKGSLKITGSPGNLAGRAGPEKAPEPRPGRNPVMRLSCEGPLTILELADRSRALITARDQVKIRREDALADRPGNFTASCQSAEIQVVQVQDPRYPNDPKRKRPEVDKVSGRGNVQFEDSLGIRGAAETLEWDRTAGRARLGGAPFVTADQAGNRVRARTVDVLQMDRVSVFRGDVVADFVPPQADAKFPLRLKSKTLTARSSPPQATKKGQIEALEAEGDVEMELPVGAEMKEPAVARADRFSYNLPESRGRLDGAPFVRVVQGESLILAPLILLAGQSTLVLQGPKRVRLVQLENGKRTAVSLTSDGDIVLDPGSRKLRMALDCVIRTDDFTLHADRVELTTGGEKGIQALRAYGNIRAVRPKDGLTVYGERMRFMPEGQTLSIVGLPDAVADAGRYESRQREIRFHQKTQRVEMIGEPGRVRTVIFGGGR